MERYEIKTDIDMGAVGDRGAPDEPVGIAPAPREEVDRWLPEEGWLFPLLFSIALVGACVVSWFLDRASAG